MPIITAPDGQNYKFPDDMPNDQIVGILKRKWPDLERQAAAATGKKPYEGAIETATKAVQNVGPQFVGAMGGLEQMGGEAVTQALDQTPKPTPAPDDPMRIPGIDEVVGNFFKPVGEAIDYTTHKVATSLPDETQDYLRKQAALASVEGQLIQHEQAAKVQPLDAKPGSIEDYFGQTVGAVAQTAPAILASVIAKNPTPALVLMGLQQMGTSYGVGRGKGLSPDDARTYSMLQTAAEVIPETLPLGVFLEHGGTILKKLVGGSIAEGATEALTQGVQSLVDKGFIEPDMTWGEAWPKIVQAGIVGAGAGLVIGGAAHGADAATTAVGAGLNAAKSVSAEVLGGGVRMSSDFAKAVKSTIDKKAAEATFRKTLEGKPVPERVDMLKAWQQQQREQPQVEQSATQSDINPASVIKTFEGFSTGTYWDVNHDRVGYGSDTITLADGTVKEVKAGDTVTREDADRDLERRIDTQYIPSIISEVGVKAWNNLPASAQAALTSITYNYGNLPNDVAAAVRTGDLEAIAEAVNNRGDDNGGVNAERRAREAAIILGKPFTPTQGRETVGNVSRRTKEASDGIVSEVQGQRKGEQDTEILQTVPRRDDAGVAQNAPDDTGTEVQGQRTELRVNVPQAGQVETAAVQGVRQSEVGKETPGLQQAPAGRVAVPGTSAGAIAPEAAPARPLASAVAVGKKASDLTNEELKGRAPVQQSPAPSDDVIGSSVAEGKRTKAGVLLEEDNTPLIVMHGTPKMFDRFDAKRQGRNSGTDAGDGFFFTTNPKLAKSWSGRRMFGLKAGHVHTFNLTMKNPRVVDMTKQKGLKNTFGTKMAVIDGARQDGHDGVIFRNMADASSLDDAVRGDVYVVFDPKQVSDRIATDAKPKSKMDRLRERDAAKKAKDAEAATKPKESAKEREATADQGRDQADGNELATEAAAETFDLVYNPGPNYIGNITGPGKVMPARQASVQVATGKMDIPDEVTKRDEPRKKLIDVVGDRIYQQKVKGRSRLGFYRPANSEIRIKHYDDIEVMAHEAAHFLEFHHTFARRFKALRLQHRTELDPLSYTQDPRAIGEEGFAEFVRLWSTQYAAAKAAAPNFTRAFETELHRARLWKKMTAFQQAAHRWYYQGELAQFRGKSGESDNAVDGLKAFARARMGSRFLQGFIDPAYAAKVIERETTGTIASAERSPYKLYRMTRGAESMTEAAIQDGALVLEADGSYGTTGKSLEAILYPATKKGWPHFDKLMEYFKARRAEELMAQGRERLFTKGEIQAGLALANPTNQFAEIFDEWLTFNDTMLTFYRDMGLITSDMLAAFRDRNKAYVPFFRVNNSIVPESQGKDRGKIGMALKGGEQATREIATNILDGLHNGIQSALTARAKAKLFSTLQGSQNGSEFAVRIAPDSKMQKVATAQMAAKLTKALHALGFDTVDANGMVTGPGTNTQTTPIDISDIDAVLQAYPELMEFWLHNQEPTTKETEVEPVIINDTVQYFEVRSPLLAAMMVSPRAAPMIVRVMRAPKQLLTNAITNMPQFQIPNLARDTVGSGAKSQTGFRIGLDSGLGMKSYILNDARFKAFRANGGLFSGRVDAPANSEKMRTSKMLGLPPRGILDRIGQALSAWRTISAGIEQGTRIGEFGRAEDRGINRLEGAYRGRMISGDFAQMGRNEVWGWLLQTIPFANAGLRGIESDLVNMFEVNGKARANLKSLGKLGMMTVTRAGIALVTMSILLWWLNHDDERYKGLTVDEKARFWHFWLPDGQHIQVPKPYGVGFIFGDLPEIALDFMQAKLSGGTAGAHAERDAMAQLTYSLMQHFWFMDYPGIINPTIEAMQNRKFTGAPIVPANLSELTGDDVQYQRTDRTPEIYRRLGELFHISPLMAEHYAKGFGGYVEAYMVDATEAALWNEAKWGPRPFSRNVFDYFASQFNGSEHPARTKYTEGYYDLRARAASKAVAYNLLFKEAGARDASSFTTFTKSEVNLTLRTLAKKFASIDKTISSIAGQSIVIKYDPKLTREEKEAQINALYDQRNKALADVYKQADALVVQLEQGIK